MGKTIWTITPKHLDKLVHRLKRLLDKNYIKEKKHKEEYLRLQDDIGEVIQELYAVIEEQVNNNGGA